MNKLTEPSKPPKSAMKTGGAWGPAPLAPLPNNHPWTFNELRAVIGQIIEKQREIIAAINDCHPGGCPGPAVAAPVLPPVANPIPPPPDHPPPFDRNVRARLEGGRRRIRRTQKNKNK